MSPYQLPVNGIIAALPTRPTAIPKTGLHGFTRSHDTDTANLALKCDAIILQAQRRLDSGWSDGKVIETLFDEETDNAIGRATEVDQMSERMSDMRYAGLTRQSHLYIGGNEKRVRHSS